MRKDLEKMNPVVDWGVLIAFWMNPKQHELFLSSYRGVIDQLFIGTFYLLMKCWAQQIYHVIIKL